VSGETVVIRYRRLPDRETVFEQKMVHDGGDHLVTLLEAAPLDRAVTVRGAPVLEPGAPVVWVTYPGLWYDVGRFHLRDGTFTGWYANVLTPVQVEGTCWSTTDLCLDVWRPADPDGEVALLDEGEFEAAVRREWIDAPTARRALDTAASLRACAEIGSWPLSHATEWTLERARAALAATVR
jgi:predicted RNA-binding protein associated with RNAse of E/G family